MAYTEFDYKIMVAQLKQHSDSRYQDFQNNHAIGSDFLYGVKISKLREIADRIIGRDWKGFLNVAKDNSYEEIMIQGIVIARADCSIHEKLAYAERYILRIDNWAICDTFCYELVDVRANRNAAWNFLMRFINSKRPFERRFVLCMLMKYFMVDEYIDDVFRIIVNINKDNYYVVMAAAGAIAAAYVKYKEKTLGILRDQILDPETHNNALIKCMDSYRISNEDKQYLKQLVIRVEE